MKDEHNHFSNRHSGFIGTFTYLCAMVQDSQMNKCVYFFLKIINLLKDKMVTLRYISLLDKETAFNTG